MIVLLPLMIAMIWFGKYSYEKVETTSEDHQNSLMDFYMGRLDQMLVSLKEHISS